MFWLREIRVAAVVLVDLISLGGSGLIAFLLWALPVRHQSFEIYAGLWPLSALFLLSYAQAGLYPGTGLGPVETLRRLTIATSLTFLLVAGLSFVLKLPYVYSRVTFAIAFAAALLVVPIARLLALALFSRTRWWPEPVVVAAAETERAQRLIRELHGSPQLGYRPAALLWLGSPEVDASATVGLPRIFAATASTAAVALLAVGGGVGSEEFDRLQRAFHRVLVVREFDDLPVEGIRLHNLGSFLGVEYTNNLLDARNRAIKRLLDLALGSIALAAAGPIIVLSLLAVQLFSRGPFLYRQLRTGLDGRRIRVPKIRTMLPDADEQLEQAMADDPELREEWRQRMKLRDDPRLVPHVGRHLRRFSLDEFPQLWSVLRGDMSLVGPRPFPDYHLRQFTPRFLDLRQRVRPGITGLWQVTVRSEGSLEQQEALDTYYIRNWSVWLDLFILGRTLGAVLSGRGAY